MIEATVIVSFVNIILALAIIAVLTVISVLLIKLLIKKNKLHDLKLQNYNNDKSEL